MSVSAHRDAITLFEEADTKSEDADVKLLAAGTLPALQLHLAMAHALKRKLERSK